LPGEISDRYAFVAGARARWLAEMGHDAVHASEISLARASDSDVLENARRGDRIVITADLDYPRLLALAEAIAPGLILFRGGDWTDLAVSSRMGALLKSLSPLEIEGGIVVVDHQRIRRRRLPIGR
jgi:predicted nuclease of predicted toxin-antitoxin system